MGYDWLRVFLKVVGRQRMVSWGDESLEETPGLARNQTESPGIRRGEWFGARAPGRKTDLPRDRWSGNPENEERKHDCPNRATSKGDNHQCRHRKQDASGHALIHCGELQIDRILGLGCGHPLQQMPVRNEHALP